AGASVKAPMAPNARPLHQVTHDATMVGDGTTVSPLGIANGGVTGPKIAAGHVVKSLNGLSDNVSFTAGTNITITPSGNSLNIAAPTLLGSVAHDTTLAGSGTSATPLRSALPLSLSSSDAGSLMTVTNSQGIGLSATGSTGIQGRGADKISVLGGVGVSGIGGNNESAKGGTGMEAFGGSSNRGDGGIRMVGR